MNAMFPALGEGQRYWILSDPNRGCYTCSRPPDGRFHDGSPSYRCSHPPTLGLPDVVTVDLSWTATTQDVQDAYDIALIWQKDDAERGGKEWEPKAPWTQLTTDWRSILSEEAASAITGLPRVKTLLAKVGSRARRRKEKPWDIGQRTEVRCPQARGRGLRFTKKDLEADRLGLLMYDDLFRPYSLTDHPTFTTVGWADFNAVDRTRYATRYSTLEKPEWSIPLADLQPMFTFPEDA